MRVQSTRRLPAAERSTFRLAGAGRSGGPRGFTLMEVLLAATIFAIAMAALTVTFRTGIRAWRIGHSSSEIFQTARIAQDVILRDLHNTAYMTERDYNNTFRDQMGILDSLLAGMNPGGRLGGLGGPGGRAPEGSAVGQIGPLRPSLGDDDDDYGDEYEDDYEDDGEYDNLDFLRDIMNVSPPIDLSFHGEDGGLLDTLDFVRHQRPRSTGESNLNGFRRVKFYVVENILYREESDIYGYRRGEQFEKFADPDNSVSKVAALFYGPGAVEDQEEPTYYSEDEKLDLLPSEPPTGAEPICEGVEVFNITYGFFRFGQWNEVDTWDSSRFQHRFPLGDGGDEEFMIGSGVLPPGREGMGAINARTESMGMAPDRRRPQLAMVNGKLIRFEPQPDNLPGYIAIQLGIRDPLREGGRLHSFTFFISMPMAREEFDTTAVDDTDRPDFIKPGSYLAGVTVDASLLGQNPDLSIPPPMRNARR